MKNIKKNIVVLLGLIVTLIVITNISLNSSLVNANNEVLNENQVLMYELSTNYNENINAFNSNPMPTHARVGLHERYRSVESVQISNNSINIGQNNVDQFDSHINFTSTNGFRVALSNDYFIQLNQQNSFNEAVNLSNYINSQGFNSSIAVVQNSRYFVYINGINSHEERQRVANLFGGQIIPPNNRTITVSNNYGIVMVFDDPTNFPQFSPADSQFITLRDRPYRGILEIGMYSNPNLTVVNILTVNEYLYSVVPAEMPALWHKQALKAQSVLARNYVWQRSNRAPSHGGYYLVDTVQSQRYLGVNSEHPNSTASVRATQNVMLTYNNLPIEAVYFSSSGGVTAYSKNVWGQNLSYLTPVQDIHETGAKEWYRTFTMHEINQIVTARNINIGRVTNVAITETERSGRVNELTFIGTNGSHSIRKEEIRTFFAVSEGGSLSSRNFYMSDGTTLEEGNNTAYNIYVYSGGYPINKNVLDLVAVGSNYAITDLNGITVQGDSTSVTYTGQIYNSSNQITKSVGDTVTFVGRGWGHGVGMSQHGARGMAEAGFNYRQIIEFYFRGVTIS
jgi:stage II sporulation protein D